MPPKAAAKGPSGPPENVVKEASLLGGDAKKVSAALSKADLGTADGLWLVSEAACKGAEPALVLTGAG